MKNLNPNVLNFFHTKSSFASKNSNNNVKLINDFSGSAEDKKEINKNICLKEAPKKINFAKESIKKLSFAKNKKIFSSPYLLKNSSKLTESNLENPQTAISRNSSNISILDYQLEKNNNDYCYLKKTNNYLDNLDDENNFEISAENPLLLSNADLDEFIIKTDQSLKKNLNNENKNRASLPRSISYQNNLCVNIDKDIYNSILQNIYSSLNRKEPKKEQSLISNSDPNKDQISENSFKIKQEISRSNLLQEESGNKIKKFTINSNNYTANINGYAPLVKKTEIKNNNTYNYYEYRDENNKKVVFKTKVLESSELLNRLEEKEKEILCFDVSNNYIEANVKELKRFQWDNLPAYIDKQEKLAKKQSLGNEPLKKLNFFSFFSNIIKDQIIKKVDSDKMKKAFAIFLVTLMLQLILSRK